VLAAIVALCDPCRVVLGGPWGGTPQLVESSRSTFAKHPRTVELAPAKIVREPALSGARDAAIAALHAELVSLSARR